MKGADVVMQTIVQYNDWLEEEVKGHDFVKEIQNFNFEQINFIFNFFCLWSLFSVEIWQEKGFVLWWLPRKY